MPVKALTIKIRLEAGPLLCLPHRSEEEPHYLGATKDQEHIPSAGRPGCLQRQPRTSDKMAQARETVLRPREAACSQCAKAAETRHCEKNRRCKENPG